MKKDFIEFAKAVFGNTTATRSMLLFAAFLGMQALFVPEVRAASPCCAITAIDKATGVVTAKENATGRMLEFKVSDSRLLNSLRVGQGVYANFGAKQVSVDGITPCCAIISLGAAPASAPAAAAQVQDKVNPVQPCCGITSIDATTGVVTAKENATGKTFQFQATGATLLKSLKVGQGVYANFGAKQVSVDGAVPCCAIVSLGNVPTSTGMVPQSGQTTQPPPQSSDPGKDKNKPGDKKTDASKTSLGSGTVMTATENTTESAIRGATAAGGQPKNDKGKVMLMHTAQPNIRIPQTQATPGNVINPNPSHLPDLFPNAVGGSYACSYSPSESCEQQCPPFTARIQLGVKNATQYAASGTVQVILQDLSGNTVRSWPVNGLAGNGEAYPGYYTYTIQWCSSGGSTGYVAVPPPNYVLLVKTPNGVADFDPNNNRAEIYIRPDAAIAP